MSSFVGTRGSQFVVDGRPYYINGFNAYFLMAISVDAYSRPRATALLEEAASAGLNTCRTWAFNDGNGYESLQTSPAVYDERVFQGLDFVISEAKRVGIRLILSLCNNWRDYGGKAQYVQWARTSGDGSSSLNSEDAFFSNSTTKGFYKNHIKTVLTRINTITGVSYKDDPTIFSWELMNEPRCLSDRSGDTLQAWIEEMAPYVKSIDSNHLLQVGLEGFYGTPSSIRVDANPNSYCQQLGTDFIKNHQAMGVDYATIHAYPDSWLGWNVSIEERIAFMKSWVAAHVTDCSSGGGNLHMPVMVAEMGLSQWSGGFSVANRDRLLAATYVAILESARAGGAAAGVLVWQLFPPGMDNWSDGYQILLSRDASTAAIITQQSRDIAALNSPDPSPPTPPPSNIPSATALPYNVVNFPSKLLYSHL
ncbi:hypothetical protein GOP47_0018975 [Adiantum capillus-veneris]|uniref:mannan endo-1,4-beta-mannosidase n=1 Tax=Adiantum capillus-veneris TaxID=13818 RepID=A0A9D4UE91_ADICA|nr:hypothetical protein GOP47_0018975 [Adiantum capillus-veneris]